MMQPISPYAPLHVQPDKEDTSFDMALSTAFENQNGWFSRFRSQPTPLPVDQQNSIRSHAMDLASSIANTRRHFAHTYGQALQSANNVGKNLYRMDNGMPHNQEAKNTTLQFIVYHNQHDASGCFYHPINLLADVSKTYRKDVIPEDVILNNKFQRADHELEKIYNQLFIIINNPPITDKDQKNIHDLQKKTEKYTDLIDTLALFEKKGTIVVRDRVHEEFS